MPTASVTSPEVARRAAMLARGPHACPWCGGPTRTDPPVPWHGLRDYLVPCEACDRPVLVKVRRERISRGVVTVRLANGATRTRDEHVEELLREPGRRGMLQRELAAASLVLLAFALVRGGSGSTGLAGFAALLTVLPASLWGATLMGELAGVADEVRTRVRQRLRSRPVQLACGRVDQWSREMRYRRAELEADPDAVFAELECILEPRELQRVREMTARGEVPLARLDPLLRRRRCWTYDEGDQIAATG